MYVQMTSIVTATLRASAGNFLVSVKLRTGNTVAMHGGTRWRM